MIHQAKSGLGKGVSQDYCICFVNVPISKDFLCFIQINSFILLFSGEKFESRLSLLLNYSFWPIKVGADQFVFELG